MADDLLRESPEESSFFLKGTCLQMCPARERILREKQRRLHPFEVLQDGSSGQKPKADIEKTVKEFSRPAAGRHLETNELRPASVLVKTMDFLLKDVLAKSDPWHFKCEFVSDRIRAVRQDLTAQGIVGLEAIEVLEKAARYYLVTAVKLCQEPVENFDPVLHDTHTQECLKKLLFLYKCTHFKPGSCPNRPSFEACYLLLNLGNPHVHHRLSKLPDDLRKCKVIQLAVCLTKAYLHGNFVAIFRILMQLPFLESCAIFRHIEPIRTRALRVMNTAFSSKNLSYPLPLLTKIFYFESEETACEFCVAHGINVTAGKVFFAKETFAKPGKHNLLPCQQLIESKLKNDITDVLLFHKQSDWNTVNNAKKPHGIVVDVGDEEAKKMVGVKQVGLVSSQKGQTCGRGRGRGRGKKK